MQENPTDRRIAIYVDPEVKQWAIMEAEKRKWKLSFFCHEVLKEAMRKRGNDAE